MTRTAFIRRSTGEYPGYPAGIPNPNIMHRHPYPTRFHGGIWTRPVFGFPQIARTSSVMVPGYDIAGLRGLGQVSYRGTGGWNVGNGVFKPGGYGGGVFDGNISGLGGNEADYPWSTYSDKTLQLQRSTNSALRDAGYCPLVEDGKLGKLTCGARLLLPTIGYTGSLMPDSCSAEHTPFTFPTKVGVGCPSTSKPVTTTTTPSTTTASMSTSASMPMSSSTKKALAFMAGGILAAVAVVYLKKRK